MKNKKVLTIVSLSIILIIMVVAIIISYFYIEKENINEESNYDNKKITIIVGENSFIMSFEDLIALGMEEFNGIFDTSTTLPVTENYKGINIKKIFEKYNISEYKQINCTANDKLSRSYSRKQIDNDEIFIVIYKNGKLLSKKDGGYYFVIVRNDDFSQSRCKYLIKIEVV